MAKIMLVEDDNNLREIYEARLLAEGYEIISAKDGEEALALAVKEKPDLIISDVMMPKISGFDMLDILRSTAETKDTKVIMMTALSQAEDKTRADKLGADRYLVKSQVTLEDVAKVAHEVLNGEEAGSTTDSIVATPVVDTAPVTAPPAPAAPAAPPVTSLPVTEPATVTTDPVMPAPEPVQAPIVEEPTVQPVLSPPEPVAAEAPVVPVIPVDPVAPVTETPEPTATEPATPIVATSSDATSATEAPVSTPEQPAPVEPAPVANEPTEPVQPTEQSVAAEAPAAANPSSELPGTPSSPDAISDDLTQTTAAEEEAIEDQIKAIFSDSTTTESSGSENPVETPPPADMVESAPMPQPSFEVPSVSVSAPEEQAASPAEAPVVPVPEPAAEAPVPEPKAPTQIQVNDASGSNPQDPAVSGKKVIRPINDISKGPDFNALLQKEAANDAVPPPIPTATVKPGDETSSPQPADDGTPSPHDIAL